MWGKTKTHAKKPLTFRGEGLANRAYEHGEPTRFLAPCDARVLEANTPSSDYLDVPDSEPLRLDCDQLLAPFRIAYKTYGELNAAKSNAILVTHALTGDQYVASQHPVTGKPGWWETMVGPGKPIDTDRFFVICPNVLGGCMGSTGPGQHQLRRPASPGASTFPSSPSATWSMPRCR